MQTHMFLIEQFRTFGQKYGHGVGVAFGDRLAEIPTDEQVVAADSG